MTRRRGTTRGATGRVGPRGWMALTLVLWACGGEPSSDEAMQAAAEAAQAAERAPDPEIAWNSGTIYFLLIDRFDNADPSNDGALGRRKDGAVLRNFEGGDLQGVLRRLQEGWFDALGVTALWMTPFVEQVAGTVDEGTGSTYGYHGYWARDWTRVDPALGTLDDLRAVVDEAHRRGIRVVMDAVINHPGPVTAADPGWPGSWVRTEPSCAFRDYESTVSCELVDGLPDFRTESDAPVDLPDFLVEKWQAEGRLAEERAELDDWFEGTGYPRAPRYYVMKWLTDWVRELGFDGYRVDTAKHFEESVSQELAREASRSYEEWKSANPGAFLVNRPFWMLGEVYNYDLGAGRGFDFGDRTVDFFAYGYDALVNFGFKARAGGDIDALDALYRSYAEILRTGPLRGLTVVNYADSHDDGSPLDPGRERPLDTGTRLLLAPGMAQIYYGDELARPLQVEGAVGDANLRSPMNWSAAETRSGQRVLDHWRILGRFRATHPAVGAGAHARIQAEPYVFSRILEANGLVDRVVVGMGLGSGGVSVPVGDVFPDGLTVRDAYSGAETTVSAGAVTLETASGLVLLEEASVPLGGEGG